MSALALEMRNITKHYPGVVALKGVHLELRKGEVHCLLGENGAGKSTLMKILAGAQPMDDGEIRLDGETIAIESPRQAQRLGIAMIHQELSLLPNLSIADNIYLGRELKRGRSFLLDRPAMACGAAEILKRIGLNVDPRRLVSSLSTAEQQLVEIAVALSVNARILVMDEPSASLTEHELRKLFEVIRSLKARGISIVYISHRLEEILAIGDRITVLRDGAHIATREVGGVTRDELVRLMVDRDLSAEYPRHGFVTGDDRLRVEGLARAGSFVGINFALRRGEIVGLTGLMGAGRTEIARAIFGADAIDAGAVYVDGKKVNLRSPRHAIAHGLGLLTEDRKQQGLLLDMTVRENVTLAGLRAVLRAGFVRRSREAAAAAGFVDELKIKTPSIEQAIKNLSGGNQQKAVLARWLFTNAKVLIFDEPTRGVDIGAKAEIYHLMNELVAKGVAILLISSELPEVLGMSDRILVMREGRIAGELSRATATQAAIMRLATGQQAVA